MHDTFQICNCKVTKSDIIVKKKLYIYKVTKSDIIVKKKL